MSWCLPLSLGVSRAELDEVLAFLAVGWLFAVCSLQVSKTSASSGPDCDLQCPCVNPASHPDSICCRLIVLAPTSFLTICSKV